ncbi:MULTISPECIES: hypothetical protein [Clostridium]|uniref:Upf86.8 n=1 Tax=Clostridium carnis TaxID=1530 RepID=A0ABY6STL8_9CLOT|nr:hypothetical protein [Clostridium carnis]CAI3661924.1 conserved hypothetical protein [Clostridium neonatale]CAI3662484.1 conserved hypothetical protein [Clostridium neonatale]CAI3682734.1 conserved hypothetical protein [Clostridium neonatale]CAI3694189.1 conserved hypothetical protein [Clostridium neonatale]CAI3706676.1 conserved hypothetical protein [Clostridium neonatale]
MKPILFNTEMVKAILEGRKTTTRRIIKVDNKLDFIGCSSTGGDFDTATFGKGSFNKLLDAEIKERIKAPYMPNDILYVRETWQISNPMGDFARNDRTAEYVYKAGYAKGKRIPISIDKEKNLGVWKPSIHMPKEAARIFLKVTDVRIERLQSITHKDVIYEGTPYDEEMFKFNICLGQDKAEFFLKSNFKDLWDSTVNKKEIDKYGWNANPWVWVIEFERIDKSEVEQ